MSLHDDIATLAKSKPALYIGAKTISGIVLDTFKTQTQFLVGKAIPIVSPPFGAILTTAQTVNGNPTGSVEVTFQKRGQSLFLDVLGGLKLAIEFGILNATGTGLQHTLTDIGMLASDINFEIMPREDRLDAKPASAKFVPSIQRRPYFDDLIKQLGLDESAVARIEGVVAYSGIQTAIATMLKEPHSLSMAALFPGLQLLGPLQSEIANQSKTLVLIPTKIEQSHEAVCNCADPGDGLGATQPGAGQPNPGNPGGVGGSISIGGPTAPTPGSVKLGRRTKGVGDSGLYMPQVMAQAVTDGPFPAISFETRDSGTIGWSADTYVVLKKINLDIDQGRGAIIVELDLQIKLYGSIEFDLGKLGRIRVSDFWVKQKPGSKVIIALVVNIDDQGRVYLKPIADRIDIAGFDVLVAIGTLIGSCFGSVGAVIGFIFDTILSRIISWKLPSTIRDGISDYMATTAWKILDVRYLGDVTHEAPANSFPYAYYDAKPDSLLISGKFDG